MDWYAYRRIMVDHEQATKKVAALRLDLLMALNEEKALVSLMDKMKIELTKESSSTILVTVYDNTAQLYMALKDTLSRKSLDQLFATGECNYGYSIRIIENKESV